ncbi:ecdysone receptor-like isoform X2 [Zeugodacus cucurbitae]|uniref:ecdysone receptor-like isoform X2 n=1 Tax=Zeugodacus cucurbitae TaxID=28588 RepID=UPI0023D92CDB|nr:ecdysone receptor-like isoform X2 [Zeugodacus cucurbitae]
MMKRRWSNNGGFAFRMLEESSTEVSSSSTGLVLSTALSPSPLDSPVYGEQDLWYDAAFNGPGGHSVITSAHGCAALLPPQTTIIPLPPLGGLNNMNAGNATNGGNFGNGNVGGGGNGGVMGHGNQLSNGQLANQQNAHNNNNNLNMHNNNNTNMLHATLNQGLMNGLMGSVLGGNAAGMQHNVLNMQQHTPRSDSANSISSDEPIMSYAVHGKSFFCTRHER